MNMPSFEELVLNFNSQPLLTDLFNRSVSFARFLDSVFLTHNFYASYANFEK